MIMTRLGRGWAVMACGLLATTLALGADRPVEKILAEIHAIKITPADSKEPAEIAKRQKLVDQKAKLILELYKASPTNPELVQLMPERWQGKPSTMASNNSTRAEIDEILNRNKNPKLVAEAAFYKANLAISKAGSTPHVEDVLPAIDDYHKRFPKDDRAGQLLYQLASKLSDKSKQAELYKRIQKDFPESPAAQTIEERAKQLAVSDKPEDRVGSPFVLSFIDAIKGSQVSIEGLKGKVVVIDFWATWCGPCVAEMPKMKELYAKYKEKGVEFIGVSLDLPKEKGGLIKLKDYVANNKIDWPQYYQGNFWQSEFSSSWKVNSIPCVFLVDADGNLATIEARGKLEKLIPEYLEKAKSKSGPAKTAANP
jgi:thiol-disulfide isomerase/thioredoxin